MTDGNDNVLDFCTEESSDESEIELGIEYDPRPIEDTARKYIAYFLIGLLWVVVGGILILVAFGSIELTDIDEFAVILGPVIALVSAATGFYYGTKSTT